VDIQCHVYIAYSVYLVAKEPTPTFIIQHRHAEI
jgi:hypothetical protein